MYVQKDTWQFYNSFPVLSRMSFCLNIFSSVFSLDAKHMEKIKHYDAVQYYT